MPLAAFGIFVTTACGGGRHLVRSPAPAGWPFPLPPEGVEPCAVLHDRCAEISRELVKRSLCVVGVVCTR